MISFFWFALILGVMILVHEVGHFLVAKRLRVRVDCFSLGFGPRLFGWKQGETEYRLSLIPLGGYVKMAGETSDAPRTGAPWEFLSKPIWARAAIVLAGPLVNYLMAFCLFLALFLTSHPQSSNKIGAVLDDFPAAASGLRSGDRLLSVGGEKTPYWEDVRRVIAAHLEGGRLTLQVEREGRMFTLAVEPKIVEQKDLLGHLERKAVLGIHPSEEVVLVRYPVPEAIGKAGHQLFSLTVLTLKALGKLVTGGLPMRDSLTGPIGIFFITRQAVMLGIPYLLQICGVLSASLAIFNVLPIPVLDGGHLFFLGIEALKGKPVSDRVQDISRQVGFYLLMGLMLFVFYNDIMRWLGGAR